MSLKISIIYGSTRDGRLGIRFAKYLMEHRSQMKFRLQNRSCIFYSSKKIILESISKFWDFWVDITSTDPKLSISTNDVVVCKRLPLGKYNYQVHTKRKIVCVFQPHRISRLRDLHKEFSFSFQNADIVILCPVYLAGEKIKLGFSYLKFAKEIIKNSKVRLFLIKDNFQLAKFIKKNIYGKKIVIGMGAGTISNWMRELPKLIK